MTTTSRTTRRILATLVAAALPALAACSGPAGATSPPAAAPAAPTAPAATPASASASAVGFDLPEGWTETTMDQELPAGVRYERVALGSAVAGFQTNINVVSQQTPPGATVDLAAEKTIDDFRQQGQEVLAEAEPAGAFGGEEGVRYTTVLSETDGQAVHQTQVVVGHADRLYFITLTGDSTDPALETVLDGVRSSWAWT